MMSVFYLIVSHRPPVIVQNVVSKCANLVVCSFPPSVSNHAVVSSRVDALLKVSEARIVAFRIPVRFEDFF